MPRFFGLVCLVAATLAARVDGRLAGDPIRFEPAGQGYLARGQGYALQIAGDGFALGLPHGAGLRMLLQAADPSTGQPEERLPSVTSYFLGNDPARWRSAVPNFGRVRYNGVYPGIDVVYYGAEGKLEYDFIVHPGADPGQIRLQFSGADSIRTDSAGDLRVEAGGQTVVQKRALLYQEHAGRRIPVASKYRIEDGVVRFEIAEYDPGLPLVIDPAVVYASYFGGSGDDRGTAIAVDAQGNTYVAGNTASTNLPFNGTAQTAPGGGGDVFVAKFTATGTLVWGTYLGGNLTDNAFGIAVDSQGAVTVVGETLSTNFPLKSAGQSTPGGNVDAFVTKIAADGTSLVYSTYLGGSSADSGRGVALDTTGAAFVTGYTYSNNFPTLLPLQGVLGGPQNAFVAKLSSTGALVFSTYLGGNGNDSGSGIAVDLAGTAWVTGLTQSTNFPTLNAIQSQFSTACIFLSRVSAGGTLISSTYFGTVTSRGIGVVVDNSQAPTVLAQANTGMPVPGAAQPMPGQGISGPYVVKFLPSAAGVSWATYLGGGNESANGIAVDGAGSIYIAGTTSTGLPVVNPILATPPGGSSDMFLIQLNNSGAIVYSTYLGGPLTDQALAVAADSSGQAYVTGLSSGSYPVVSAVQANYGGGPFDAIYTKISAAGTPTSLVTNIGPDSAVAGSGGPFTLTVNGNGFSASAVIYWNATRLSTTFINHTTLTASVPSALIASAGTAYVSVANPSETNSNAVAFRIAAAAFAPTFTSVSVFYTASPTGGLASKFIRYTGYGITNTTQVIWNGTAQTNPLNFQYQTVGIPTALVQTPGATSVQLGSPGGPASNTLTFTIPPLRTVSTVSPANVSSQSGPLTLSLTGTNFASGDLLIGVGSAASSSALATVSSSTALQGTLAATITASPQTLFVWVDTPGTGSGPNSYAHYSSANQGTMNINAPCVYNLSATSANVGSAASTGSFNVTGNAGCPYTVASDSTWLTITSGATGTANVTPPAVNYSVAANTGPARSGNLTVLNYSGSAVGTFAVSQGQAPCSALTIVPNTATFGPAGGTGVANFSTYPCAWTASSNQPWATVPASGTGSSLNYAIAANPGTTARTATITVNGSPLTVTQNGRSCAYTIATSSTNSSTTQGFLGGGGIGNMIITTAPGCAWGSSSNVPWISVNGAASGSGNGGIGFTVASNTGTTGRIGVLTVANLNYVITQDPPGPQGYSCTLNSPTVPNARSEGITEQGPDLVLSCFGTTVAGGVKGDVQVTLNTTLTNHSLTTDASGTVIDALLIVNETAAPVLGTNAFRGRVTGPNSVRFFNVPLTPAAAGSFSQTLRITNLRFDMSALGAGVSSATADVAILAPVPFPVSGTPVSIASAVPGVFVNPQPSSAGPLAGQTIQPIGFFEQDVAFFRTKIAANQDPSTIGTSYFSESGFVNTAAFGPETGKASNATRFLIRVSGVPAGVSIYAPMSPTGTGTAQLISADANGVGGYPYVGGVTFGSVNYQPVRIDANGNGSATWEVVSADPTSIDTFIMGMLIASPSAANISSISFSGSLAPVIRVSAPSRTALFPRFFGIGTPTPVNVAVQPLLLNGGLPSAKVQGAYVSVVDRDVVQVGGTNTLTETLLNTGSATAGDVQLGGTFSVGTLITACIASDGGTCTFNQNGYQATYGTLGPGQNPTVSVQFQVPAAFAGGFVQHTAGVSSDSPNVNFSAAAYSTNFLVNSAPTYSLTLAATPPAGGSITPNPVSIGSIYSAGTQVSITATANTGWVFSGFTGDLAGATNPQTLTMSTNRSVTANYAPVITLNRTSLNFGARQGGASTPGQPVQINIPAGVAWSANGSAANIQVTPANGSGPGVITISVTAGASGNVNVTSQGAQTQVVTVNIRTLPAAGSGSNPSNTFGVIDQPGASQTTGFSGAMAVTGWALDDLGVQAVSLFREPVPQDVAGSIQTVLGKQLVYIGDAIFLPDTRPDVAAASPTAPQNYRGGWGMLFLTNTTLNNNGTPGVGGSGTYILHIIATSVEGFKFELGTRTVAVDNQSSTLPFGTIDTPAQGQANITGTQFVNFGWALTPQPKMIPLDGSTMFVSIDGAFSGRPTYGFPRSDIDGLFPGYKNSGKAVGYFYIDMTKLTSGIHSIAWSVRDDGGALQGIGSRVFYVNNPGGPIAEPLEGHPKSALSHPGQVLLRTGPDFDAPLRPAGLEEDGRYHVTLWPGERLELHTGRELAPLSGQNLPPCASVDAAGGIFYWQPPIMALGDFQVPLRLAGGGTLELTVSIRLR